MKRILLSISILLISLFCARAQNEISYRIERSFERMFYNSNDPVIDITVYNRDNYEKYAEDESVSDYIPFFCKDRNCDG